MDSASSHAYVSKNFIEAYLKKKEKLKQKREQPQVPQMMAEGGVPMR